MPLLYLEKKPCKNLFWHLDGYHKMMTEFIELFIIYILLYNYWLWVLILLFITYLLMLKFYFNAPWYTGNNSESWSQESSAFPDNILVMFYKEKGCEYKQRPGD